MAYPRLGGDDANNKKKEIIVMGPKAHPCLSRDDFNEWFLFINRSDSLPHMRGRFFAVEPVVNFNGFTPVTRGRYRRT